MEIPQATSRADAAEYQGDFAGLIGASARMQRVYHLIAKVAVKRNPVLILGEAEPEKNWWRGRSTGKAHGETGRSSR